MKRLLWLLLGLGGGLLLASGGSERRQLPGRTLEDENIVDADYEIIEDDDEEDKEEDGHRAGTPDIIQTIVGATQQSGVARVYETLVRESVRSRDEWHQKFSYQELTPIERDDPDVKDFITEIEQAGPVDADIVDRLQEFHRRVYHHRNGKSSSLHLHCPFCRRETRPQRWYCSYCGVKRRHVDYPITGRCNCERKPTALVCYHCQIPIPTLVHTAEIEWDMPALPSELIVSKTHHVVPYEDPSELEQKREHQQKKKEIDREARMTELINDADAFLQFRHQLEALYAKEEERLAEKHGRESEKYENGLRELSTLLTTLEGQYQNYLRNNNPADEPPTQTL